MHNTQRILRLCVAVALISGAGAAAAQPFASLDPRGMAMGGAVVAAAHPNMAPIYNPALLGMPRDKEGLSTTFAVGARAYDPGEFVDGIDNIETTIDALDASIANVENNPTVPGNFDQLAADTEALNSELTKVDQQPIMVEAGVALTFAKPSAKLGVGLGVSGGVSAHGIADYEDDDVLTGLATDARAIEDCRADPVACQTNPPTFNYITVDDPTDPQNVDVTFTTDDLASTADVRAVGIGEIGLSFARDFGVLSAGITPKLVKITTIDYRATVSETDDTDVDDDQYVEEDSSFNFDLAVAKQVDQWRFGAIIKNVIPREYDTAQKALLTPEQYEARGGAIKLDPRARVGASYTGKWGMLAADLDLTDNESVGFDGSAQYLSLGGELGLGSWFALRGGYRADLSESARDVASAGFGVKLAAFHFDLGLAGNSDEVGASGQFGLRF